MSGVFLDLSVLMPIPTDISGLMLWCDAADITVGQGFPFDTWPDKSGNGRDLTQATGAKQPTLRQSPTGDPCAEFDGVDDFMKTPAFPSPTAGVSVFIVYQANLPIGASYWTVIQHATGATWADPYARYCMRVSINAPGGLEVWINQYGAPRLVVEDVMVEEGVPTLYEIGYDLTTLATYRNLGFQNGTVASTALASSNFPVYVGSNTDGGELLSGYVYKPSSTTGR